MKGLIFAGMAAFVLVACGDSSSNEPDVSTLAAGDHLEILKTQNDDGDLQTIWVEDEASNKYRYDVEKVISDGKEYVLVNYETKDTVIANVDDEQVAVVEVLEYNGKASNDEKKIKIQQFKSCQKFFFGKVFHVSKKFFF